MLRGGAGLTPEGSWLRSQYHSGSVGLWPCRRSLCLPTSHSSCREIRKQKSGGDWFWFLCDAETRIQRPWNSPIYIRTTLIHISRAFSIRLRSLWHLGALTPTGSEIHQHWKEEVKLLLLSGFYTLEDRARCSCESLTDLFLTIQYFLPSTSSPSKP